MGNEEAVLFIGASGPIIGHEKEAMGFWLELAGRMDTAQKAGWFSRWDAFWLTPHGGDMNTAFVCYGDRAKLDEMRRTDEWEAWMFRAQSCMQGLGVIPGVNFAAARETMARRNKAVGSDS